MKNNQLKEYFQRELDFLRDKAQVFAHDYPGVARDLRLSNGKSADPHVELLMQSFAFLTGRLHYRLDCEQASLPNALLSYLYPHLQAPTPCMTIAEIRVKEDGANFNNGYVLKRGRYFSADAINERNENVTCRFQNCFDTPLWPLSIDAVNHAPLSEFQSLTHRVDAHSIINVKITNLGKDPLHALPMRDLRMHIHAGQPKTYQLYEWLAVNLKGVAVLDNEGNLVQELPPSALHWIGFNENEAALPPSVNTHPGYRLVQEYFAFPDKFLFFDLQGVQTEGLTDGVQIAFLLDIGLEKNMALKADSFKLNCLPLVNLFQQAIDPIRVDHRNYEYQLIADQTHHRYCEVYSIETLQAIRPKQSPRTIEPYFAVSAYQNYDSQDYFWASRRETSQFKSVPGTEVYISFLDGQFSSAQVADEAIGGKAICTNRRLPEQLRAGNQLNLEGPGPVRHVHLVAHPSRHRCPDLTGEQPWRLVSQLNVNYVAIADEKKGLESLKTMLRLHLGEDNPAGWRQIESITELNVGRFSSHMSRDAWRGWAQGMDITVTLDESRFDGGSVVLFVEMLRRFFALFASVNQFVRVRLKTKQRNGEVKLWPPLAGAQASL